MLDTASVLSATSLSVALERVTQSSSERGCAAALVSAASLLQHAILSGQSAQSVYDAIEACPASQGGVLAAAMDRAVNFNLLEDAGGTLGLWLIPVVLTAPTELSAVIELGGGMHALKLAGCVQEQLGLKSSVLGRSGWSYVLPTLYSAEQLRNIDIAELIRLPMQARDVVRGTRDRVLFAPEASVEAAVAGTTAYFLPVVAYHPTGAVIRLTQASERTAHRMTQWVREVLGGQFEKDAFDVVVSRHVHPFSVALQVGDRMRLDIRFRGMMRTICEQTGVAYNGLAALVAAYEVRDDEMVLGVSLSSRLTGQQLAVVTLALDDVGDGAEGAALLTHILKDLGVDRVQHHSTPLETLACQHCGNIQFALPSAAMAQQGLAHGSHTIH